MIRIFKFTLMVVVSLVSVMALWMLAGVYWPLPLIEPNERPARLVISDVSVVDVDSGQVLEEHDILVESGHITAVGKNLGVTGADRVEGRGLYAIPGLFDMHVHSTKMAPVLTHPLLVAAGVTAVRDMGGCIGIEDGFVACIDEKREWDRAVAAGEMVGPRFDQLSSLAINGGREIPAGLDAELGAPTAAGARKRVALDRTRGVDFLKTYTMLPREGYFELARVTARTEMYLAGHLPLAVTALEAIASGQRSIEHAFLFIWDCYPGMAGLRASDNPRDVFTHELRETMIAEHDADQCAALQQTMAEAGTAFVPTHTTRKLDAFALDEVFRTDDRLKYIPGPLRQMWLSDADGMARRAGEGGQQSYMDFYRFGIRQTGLAHQAGVTVLAGSDMPDSFAFPGTAIHDELDHLIEAGLSPLDALRAATLEPAKFLGLDGKAGIIRPGARADVVLLGANPLEDIRNVRRIEGVVLAGVAYRRQDLDRMLNTVESAAGNWSMWPKFIWQVLTSPIMKRQFGD